MSPRRVGATIGVDGCRAGWFFARACGEAITYGVVADAQGLASLLRATDDMLIDIPIGLRDDGPEPRHSDSAARRLLQRPRASSVFPTPLRPVLQTATYADALALSRRLSGKGLSRQAWNITPKIQEIDVLLQSDDRYRGQIREAHPELCFFGLNAGRAMQHAKRTVAGRAERVAVLARWLPATGAILAAAAASHPRKDVAIDDIVDALVLLVSARLGRKRLCTAPTSPETDAYGLPMQIVYPDPAQSQPNT